MNAVTERATGVSPERSQVSLWVLQASMYFINGKPMEDPVQKADLTDIIRVRTGDLDRYENLYARHKELVRRCILGKTPFSSDDDISDVTQNAFTKGYFSLDFYDPRKSFYRSWIVTIAVNTARDLHRYNQLRKSRNFPIEDEFDIEDSDSESLEESISRLENRKGVIRLVSMLPSEMRRALYARYQGGLTDSEVAQALGIPLGTAKTRIHNAVKRMRVLNEEYELVEK